MTKPNALVKISGNLIKNEEALKWLRLLSESNHVVVCPGGGEQINQAFEEKGFKVKFGPLGRETNTLEEKQLARNILEKNQACVQDWLDEQGIHARVEIPFKNFATVSCLIKADIMVLAAYRGFDVIYILTTKEKEKEKKAWLKRITKALTEKPGQKLDKIIIAGFN